MQAELACRAVEHYKGQLIPPTNSSVVACGGGGCTCIDSPLLCWLHRILSGCQQHSACTLCIIFLLSPASTASLHHPMIEHSQVLMVSVHVGRGERWV